MCLKHICILKMDASLPDQECVGNTVETGLNKSLPTENNESDNITGHDVGKIERRNDDANVN